MNCNGVTEQIIGARLKFIGNWGLGFSSPRIKPVSRLSLSSVGCDSNAKKPLPIFYMGIELDCGYRIDLLVEEQIVVELKTVERFEPIHDAQLLSYLKHSGCQIGLLINFKVGLLKNGIRRLVNGFPELTPRPPRPMRYSRDDFAGS